MCFPPCIDTSCGRPDNSEYLQLAFFFFYQPAIEQGALYTLSTVNCAKVEKCKVPDMSSNLTISTPANNTRSASPSLPAARRVRAKSWPILDDYALYRPDTRIFLESCHREQNFEVGQSGEIRSFGKHLSMLTEFGKASKLSYRRPLHHSFWRHALVSSGTDQEHTGTVSAGGNHGFGNLLEMDSMSIYDHVVRVADEHVRSTEDYWRGLGRLVPQSDPKLMAIEDHISKLQCKVHDQLRHELPGVSKMVLELGDAELRARMYRMYLKCFIFWKNADMRRWFEHHDEDGNQHATAPPAA